VCALHASMETVTNPNYFLLFCCGEMMFTYLIGVLFSVGIWFVFLIFTPRSQKKMIWASLVSGPAGPISQYWHVKDYWNPTHLVSIRVGSWLFGMEDFLFAFAFGGLCFGLFDLFIRSPGEQESITHDRYTYTRLFLFGSLVLILMTILVLWANLNSLYASILIFIVMSLFLFVRRPMYIVPAVLTAFIMSAYMWLAYWSFYFRMYSDLVAQWWKKGALTGIYLAGVPVEEVVWTFAASLVIGPALRYCAGDLNRGNRQKESMPKA